MLKFVPLEYRTLCTPYSPYPVLKIMTVLRAKIRTPGIPYSLYSVLPVLHAENYGRTPCLNSYSGEAVHVVLRTLRTPYKTWYQKSYPRTGGIKFKCKKFSKKIYHVMTYVRNSNFSAFKYNFFIFKL